MEVQEDRYAEDHLQAFHVQGRGRRGVRHASIMDYGEDRCPLLDQVVVHKRIRHHYLGIPLIILCGYMLFSAMKRNGHGHRNFSRPYGFTSWVV